VKIHVISDIHLEFGKFKHTPPECDAVILSGDIHPGVLGVMWALDTFGTTPVIYVPGNHEFYAKRRLEHHVGKMKTKAEGSNVHVLQNDAVVIDGVRFLGTTLWTDFNLYGNAPLATLQAQNKMNDYKQVLKDVGKPFSAHLSTVEHMVGLYFLREQLEMEFDGPNVVVTHHAPSEQSVPAQYANHPLNPAYASRLENFVSAYAPVLWTHGHIHSSSDYQIGDTRVICNPRGYVGHELNPTFDPNLVIEI
jgi:Icc-related predicted phosphoesterase